MLVAGWARHRSSFSLLYPSDLFACTSINISLLPSQNSSFNKYHLLSSLSTLLTYILSTSSLTFLLPFLLLTSTLYLRPSSSHHKTSSFLPSHLSYSYFPSHHLSSSSLPSTSPPFLLAYSPSYLLSSSHPHGKDSMCHFFPILIICCNLNHVPLPFLRSCP